MERCLPPFLTSDTLLHRRLTLGGRRLREASDCSAAAESATTHVTYVWKPAFKRSRYCP